MLNWTASSTESDQTARMCRSPWSYTGGNVILLSPPARKGLNIHLNGLQPHVNTTSKVHSHIHTHTHTRDQMIAGEAGAQTQPEQPVKGSL